MNNDRIIKNEPAMRIVDLRSDTVTLPTEKMRQAMNKAVVGDDVFCEDPTVDELEQKAADLTDKEAALFVPSGTMGNLACILAQCERGDEIILGDKCHMFLNEVGGIAALGGIHPHTVMNQKDGTMRLEDIENAVRGENIHWPRTKIICLENTHNRCYGACLTEEYMSSVFSLAMRFGINIHLDGARIFNAAVFLGIKVKDLTRYAHTVLFCLSKGLAAPIGSLICGSRKFVDNARRIRKMLGGGMRQVGVIAAPGIVAIDTMQERLVQDHKNARVLAEGIAKIQGLSIEETRVQTNILYFEITDDKWNTELFLDQLNKHGVKVLCTGPKQFRMVTHYGISADDINLVLEKLKHVVEIMQSQRSVR
jgi:threonine aldolase